MEKILEDIRVLDLTHAWFGPYCTMLFAGLGAEVIKIEPPWGALGRMGPGAMIQGASTSFYALNLNKKDLAINLKSSEGLEIFKELVKKSDIVIQNFLPGTMERMGLGYDVLKELNPRIIYAALSGFGQTGPYKTRPSFAPIAESMSGHLFQTGESADPNGPPLNMAGAYGDLGPALWAASSILAALRYRDKTGKGQMLDVAQADCMVSLNTVSITSYNMLGMSMHEYREKYPQLRGGIGGITKTKDGYIYIAGFRPRAIEKLKQELGLDELTSDTIKELVADMTNTEALDYLLSYGVPVAEIYSVKELVNDPHLIDRDMFTNVEHPKAGVIKVINFPVKFSETPGEIRTATPLLGQHNVEILSTILGYTADRIERLEKKGIISAERAR
ncbi:MAG: CaiB/BaiF CoA transferase family protein [Promethearchaeota archaeon]|jgi:crotonobetainyl-CoA:carnitine CoA-transferase CaiB-like acyl-CoA transferase